MKNPKQYFYYLFFLLVTGILMSGCATTSSTKAKPLEISNEQSIDLTRYQIVTVLPFDSALDSEIDRSVGVKFASDIETRLENDFGPLFQEVRMDDPLGQNDELIVTGTITTYKPGNKFARGMLIGLGAAKFKADLNLKDSVDGRVLLSAPISKLWAWGGLLGATKGIEDMMNESAAAVANTVARSKGWNPKCK